MASYRSEFDAEDKALAYDGAEYAPNSWSSLVWEREQALLADLLDRRSFVPRRERYLDFACGTGRVTQVVHSGFTDAVGVDISSAMIERARNRVKGVNFVAGDVIAQPDLVDGVFDLVTAFRFVLNADPADRLPVLRWIRDRLRDSDSRVIVNNHGNLSSHKAIPYAVRRLRGGGSSTTGNVLSHTEMTRLFDRAGFQVARVQGLGFLGGTALRALPYRAVQAAQGVAATIPFAHRFAENQIYVLAPRD